MTNKMDYSKFKTDHLKKPTEWFIKLKPYNKNREETVRAPKISKIMMSNVQPTHLAVDVAHITAPFDDYKKGEYIKLNGHTRSVVWKTDPKLIPNVPLNVTVYELSSAEAAYDLYLTIDSSYSVETSNDKLSGLIRGKKYIPTSRVITKGAFKTAVINVCRYYTNKQGVYMNAKEFNNKFEVKMDEFWEEIKYIDSFNLDNIPRCSGNVITALILIARKFGFNNKRVKLLFKNLCDEITTVNNTDEYDGVHYVQNVLYPKNAKIWTSGFRNSFLLISQILHGFDMFVKDINIDKKGKKMSEEDYKEKYRRYIDGL